MKNKILLSLITVTTIYAQDIPDAPESPGIQMQKLDEIDKSVTTKKDKKAIIDDLEVDEKAKGIGENRIKGPSFILQNVSITGNTILNQQEIIDIVKPLVGTSVDSIDLKSISEKITKLYTEKGYVTSKCIIPAQKVQNGNVKFEIIEDKLANIILVGEDSYNYNSNMFMKYLADLRGKVIHAEKVNEKLQLLSYLPVTKIKPSLQKTSQGYTNLILEITDAKEQFSISTDNSGSKYTGEQRFTLNGNINNIRGKSDRLALSLTTAQDTEKLTSFAMNYIHPVGNKGGKVSFEYSQMNYLMEVDTDKNTMISILQDITTSNANAKITDIDYDDFKFYYPGNSDRYGINYSKPIPNDSNIDLIYNFGFESKTTITDKVRVVYPDSTEYTMETTTKNENNETNTTLSTWNLKQVLGNDLTTVKKVDKNFVVNAGIFYRKLDSLLGDNYRGVNSLSFNIKKGVEGLLDSSKKLDTEYFGETNIKDKSNMDFLKYYLSATRQQLLPYNTILNLNFNGNYTRDRVPDSYEYSGGDYGYKYSLDLYKKIYMFNTSLSVSKSNVYSYDENMNKSLESNEPSATFKVNTTYKDLYIGLSYTSSFDKWDSNANNIRYNIKYSW